MTELDRATEKSAPGGVFVRIIGGLLIATGILYLGSEWRRFWKRVGSSVSATAQWVKASACLAFIAIEGDSHIFVAFLLRMASSRLLIRGALGPAASQRSEPPPDELLELRHRPVRRQRPAALHHVVRDAGNNDCRESWHDAMLPLRHRLVNAIIGGCPRLL